MNKFQEIYDLNIELDKMFIELYDHHDLVRKNKLELLVEIGELANETKCFKYWTKKCPDKELINEEYADCIIMTLCFFDLKNIELFEIEDKYFHLDIIDMFGKLYQLASDYYYHDKISTIKEIFILLINLGHKMGLNDEKIIDVTKRKISIGKERLKSS